MGLFHEELKGAVPKMTVILQTARDIAAGLEHVHGHHILHGDLTAGNVLLASLPAGSTGPRAFTAKVSTEHRVKSEMKSFFSIKPLCVRYTSFLVEKSPPNTRCHCMGLPFIRPSGSFLCQRMIHLVCWILQLLLLTI